MKKIILSLMIGLSTWSYSQVVIGGDGSGTATNKTSVLLDFGKKSNNGQGQGRGLILPYLTALPTSPTAGTIALDATTGTAAKVVYYNGTWQDLSNGDTSDVSSFLGIQNSATESSAAKAIIGSDISSADGVLVLESSTKAMILPIVDTVDDIVSPSPGMMVYVSNNNNSLLAVFNGGKWVFWQGKI